jgi:hypothetical protein
MNTLLYCYRSGVVNNMLGLGLAGVFVRPLTSPPLTLATFPYEHLAGQDLVYFALHGRSYDPNHLYGDDGQIAISVELLRLKAPAMKGAIVVLEGCYGALTAFPTAFHTLGAAAVISSRTATYDRRWRIGRAGRLGKDLVKALRGGCSVGEAVEEALSRADLETAAGFSWTGDDHAHLREKQRG